ncbi:MAG: hypothetical protein ACRDOI_22260, partial [Trebonia sp.]
PSAGSSSGRPAGRPGCSWPARMTAAGVEFLTGPRDEPYGRVAVFLDIAGNRWDLLGPAPS